MTSSCRTRFSTGLRVGGAAIAAVAVSAVTMSHFLIFPVLYYIRRASGGKVARRYVNKKGTKSVRNTYLFRRFREQSQQTAERRTFLFSRLAIAPAELIRKLHDALAERRVRRRGLPVHQRLLHRFVIAGENIEHFRVQRRRDYLAAQPHVAQIPVHHQPDLPPSDAVRVE